MLMILRIIFSVIAIIFAILAIESKNIDYAMYMLLALGLTMLMTGIQEINQNKKLIGWLLILIFPLNLFVFIQHFFFN